jgi:hypothetical protein
MRAKARAALGTTSSVRSGYFLACRGSTITAPARVPAKASAYQAWLKKAI